MTPEKRKIQVVLDKMTEYWVILKERIDDLSKQFKECK